MHEIPYIDLNDLNLDWVLSNMKKLISEWAAYQVRMDNRFSSLEDAYRALQDWINSFFHNLDVQTEINNKIAEMAQSGELLTIIQPTVISETDSWLASHISNPASPPLDTSLTLANAAAPAKTVGDKAWIWRGTMVTPTDPPTEGALDDLDKCDKPGVYIIGNSNAPLHTPDESTSGYRYVLLAQGSSSTFRQMIYINSSTHTIYTRGYYSSSWHAWSNAIAGMLDTTLSSTTLPAQGKAAGDAIRALQGGAFQRRDLPAGLTSLDTLTEPGWYIIPLGNSAITDCPDGATSGSRMVQIFTGSQAGYRYMIYYNHTTHFQAMRLYSSGAWGIWGYPDAENLNARLSDNSVMIRRPTISITTDLDTVTESGWYVIGNSVTISNQPTDDVATRGYRTLIVMQGQAATFYTQLYLNRTSGCTALRTHTTTGFSSWQVLTPGSFDTVLQATITPRIGKKMFDICHRGLTDVYPENSMAAFKAARAAGYDWIETDIQYTSDGVAVLQHDPEINANYCNADGSAISDTININSITYNQLLTYDRRKGSTHFEGMKVTTLSDALETFRKINLSAMLHMKEYATAARIPDIIQKVTESGMMENVAFASGYKDRLLAMSQAVKRKFIVFVGQATNCDSALAAYLESLKINGNIIGYTTGPWAYDSTDMVSIIDSLNDAGYFLTARLDDANDADTKCRPWAWAFITNGRSGFMPSKYFYDQLMEGFTT